MKSSLQQVHSDLLYSVRIGGRETLLYLLFEHQSTPDPTMPLRVLGYMMEIFTKHHAEHGLPLLPVLPFVFHQGPDTWRTSTAFEDLFDLTAETRAALMPYLPKFHHALLDLTHFDPATQEDETRLRAVLQLMKLARQKNLLPYFEWLSHYSAAEFPQALLGLMLLYALHTDGDLDVEKIYPTLSSNPELKQNTMSAADKLIAKGHAKGHIEGHAKGHETGLWTGKIQSFEQFLGKPISSKERLNRMSNPELEALHTALLNEYEARFKRG